MTRANEISPLMPDLPQRKLLFISWAPHCSRSDSIGRRLGGESVMIYAPFWGSNYLTVPIKYLVQTARTLHVLWRRRPEVVLVMVPPVFACLPVWMYCSLFRARFAIDAHSGAFLNPRFKHWQWLQKFLSRRAATTLVTNDHLRCVVEGWNASATIVTDVPVDFAEPQAVELPPGMNVTVVSSFCADEPIEVFLEAAAKLPEIHFHVTGDVGDLDAAVRRSKPHNVRFTGFLSNAEYVGHLRACDAVMALTTRDHTMQRGAYEGIYLGKPVITSDFEILRSSFPKGTVHVRPTSPEEIVRGIERLRGDLPSYRDQAIELRGEKLTQWDAVARTLQSKLQLAATHRMPDGDIAGARLHPADGLRIAETR